ncbi:hypothetical protein [Streptomyces sp. NPDC046727]|uniref:hypothetical protein n=1 Tax=Streptomyces sp. NPDC046727 TaxID=3155373 RepID=UPI0033EEA1B6
MGEQGEGFEELAYGLVQALDEWSECLHEVMAGPGPSRSGLVARLRDAEPKIDNPLLGQWLLGRDQLLGENKRSGRVPTVQDTARIVAAFRADAAPQRRRLMGIAQRIEFHKAELQKIKGHQWRSAVVTALRAPASAAEAAAPQAVRSEDSEQLAAGPTTPPTAAGPAGSPASRSWKRPAAIAATVGLLITLAIAAKGWSGSAEQGGQVGPSAGSATSAAGTTPRSGAALGGDSRCSPPKAGPSGVQLRACAKVERDRVVFALKVDNPTATAAPVTVKVGGFWAGAAHVCEPGPALTHITVDPGTTFTTDPAHCGTGRQEAPLAYQGEAYIAAGDGQEWTGHAWSPRANVYSDRETQWRCGGDVPC